MVWGWSRGEDGWVNVEVVGGCSEGVVVVVV